MAENKPTKLKTRRLLTFFTSLVITVAAIAAIIIIATIGSKKQGEDTSSINTPTPIAAEPTVIPNDNPVVQTDDPGAISTNNSASSADASSESNPNTNPSANHVTPVSPADGTVPDTGPSDVIGLALLLGSATAFIISKRMATQSI